MNWSLKQIGAATVGLATVVGATIAVYEWLTRPEGKLEANAVLHEYAAAPNGQPSDLPEDLLAESNPVVARALREADTPDERLVLFQLLRDLRVQSIRRQTSTESLSGYWVIEVRNDGSKAVTSVQLRVDGARLVEVKKAGQAAKLDAIKEGAGELGPIQLETLQPTESATVRVWTSYSTPRQPILTHDSGVGTVEVVKRDIGALGRFVDDYESLFVVLLLVMTWFMAMLLLVSERRVPRKANSEVSERTKTDPKPEK